MNEIADYLFIIVIINAGWGFSDLFFQLQGIFQFQLILQEPVS